MLKFTLRLNETLRDRLLKTAGQNRHSLNDEILCAIEYYLKNAPEAQIEKTTKMVEVKPE